MYVCVLHSYGAQENQKMVSDPQGLGLQTLVSHRTWVLWTSSHVLSTTKPSLQPHHKPLNHPSSSAQRLFPPGTSPYLFPGSPACSSMLEKCLMDGGWRLKCCPSLPESSPLPVLSHLHIHTTPDPFENRLVCILQNQLSSVLAEAPVLLAMERERLKAPFLEDDSLHCPLHLHEKTLFSLHH